MDPLFQNAILLQKQKHQRLKKESEPKRYEYDVPLLCIDLARLYSSELYTKGFFRKKVIQISETNEICPNCKKNLRNRWKYHFCHVCLPCYECSEIVRKGTEVFLHCVYHACIYDLANPFFDLKIPRLIRECYEKCNKFHFKDEGKMQLYLLKHSFWRCWHLCSFDEPFIVNFYISWIPEEVANEIVEWIVL
jgi:hypothetical protein